MSRTVELTPQIISRIIQEERQKIIAEAQAKKSHQPKEPTVKGGKKSTVLPEIQRTTDKARKAMHLAETETEADELAGSVIKQAKQLKVMREIARKLRSQLEIVVESRIELEKRLAKVL
jgi:hypothetical protein